MGGYKGDIYHAGVDAADRPRWKTILLVSTIGAAGERMMNEAR